MKKGLHKFKKVCYDNPRWETSIAIWACSSVGRAFGSHPKGRGFESLQVHQKEEHRKAVRGCLVSVGHLTAHKQMIACAPRFSHSENACDAPLGAFFVSRAAGGLTQG